MGKKNEAVQAVKPSTAKNAGRGAGSKKSAKAANAKRGKAKVTVNRPKLLITVVDREKAEYYFDYIESFGVNFQFAALAEGTAPAEIRHLLAAAGMEKTVLFSVVPESLLKSVLAGLEEKFAVLRGGKGVAFTVGLSSVIGKAIFAFITNNRSAAKGGEK